jgi:hypothetical protein
VKRNEKGIYRRLWKPIRARRNWWRRYGELIWYEVFEQVCEEANIGKELVFIR